MPNETPSTTMSSTSDGTAPAGHRTRDELLAAHRVARARRAAAELGSDEYLEAIEEIGRLEVEIARLGREQVPPSI